ncbi:MAG: tRNA (N(6)-L-threonylcarbamoyladenosine(37)-C(2))-methylthiotransferase MtaB [Flavobacteriales bacterium]|nr:tRNA (N(6)-L-threonylcarbamoyladenosine(37)-C(2))-methylthiotransferase MtaB [Flavobacteriales bacterium]|tara:strand:- start:1306 stop:2619 length:1314 start_codon:yes stop_codon:yes gene_type:complete
MFKGKTVAFYTLGCKLNFSESSTISRQLNEIGFVKTEFNDGADMYIINTCSVTENANKECRRLIRKAKKISPESFVVITGCFAQLKPKSISEMEGVDMVLGANDKFNLPNLLQNLDNKKIGEIHGCEINNLNYTSSYSLGERTRSFLKIQDGCDYPCTYCTIPLARGKSRCDTIENILKNAIEIAKNGIKEIVITGVNIGEFRDDNKRFSDLIKELEKIDGIERFRISSIEPNLITDEIIETVKNSKKFMPHFHIPLQSGSDKILGKMKRRYRTDLYKEKLEKIVKAIPEVCIGADVIVGFPGETDELFNTTMNFIKNLPISYLHVFSYSERENTLATTFEGIVEKNKRVERSKMLRILSDKLQRSYYQKYLGSIQTALLEKENKNGFLFGFTDNYIKVKVPFTEELVQKKINLKLLSFDENGSVLSKIKENICIQQ